MKRNLIQFASVALSLALCRAAAAQTTNTAAQTTNEPAASQPTNDVTRLDLASFQIIAQRNIFDPNRRTRTTNTQPAPRPVQVDSFTYNGGAEANGKLTAIFTGSSFRYTGRYTTNDTIAGYKIIEIDPAFDFVKLGAASNQVVKMGFQAQMRRYDGGAWSLSAAAEAEPETKPAIALSQDSPSNTPPSSTGGVENDIVQKLMKRRAQENAKPETVK